MNEKVFKKLSDIETAIRELDEKALKEINGRPWDYAKDGRLAGPSDGKSYEWRKMIKRYEELGRPLTENEAEEFRIK